MSYDPQNAPDVDDTDDPAELVDIDIAMNREAFEAAEADRKASFGTEGQDRESYSDTQDRDCYTVDEDTDRGDR